MSTETIYYGLLGMGTRSGEGGGIVSPGGVMEVGGEGD